MLGGVIVAVAIVVGAFSAASAQEVKLPEIEFGRYHAPVIGNNDYQHLPKLTTAVGASETLESLQQKLIAAQASEEALKQQLNTGLQDEKALRDLERATAENLAQVRRRLAAAVRKLRGPPSENPELGMTRPIITAAHVGVNGRLTIFILDVSAPIKVQRVFTLLAPYRVIIDLPSSKNQPGLWSERVNTGVISAYRSGRLSVRTFRMVLEVKGPARVLRHYPLPADSNHGHRYVFHLEPVSAAMFARERQAPPVLLMDAKALPDKLS